MQTILSVTQVLVAIAMIAIILVQRGAGAAAGSGFGAGASGTVFGARGSGSFLTRTTSVLAAAFFVISMTMAIIAGSTVGAPSGSDLGVMAGIESEAAASDLPEVPGRRRRQAMCRCCNPPKATCRCRGPMMMCPYCRLSRKLHHLRTPLLKRATTNNRYTNVAEVVELVDTLS